VWSRGTTRPSETYIDLGRETVIGKVTLPIAGLMSDKRFEEVAQDIEDFAGVMGTVNLNYHAVSMNIVLLTLPVIPEIRITDKGLVNAVEGRLTEPVLNFKES